MADSANARGYLNVRLQEKSIDFSSVGKVGGTGIYKDNYNISLLKGERAILKVDDYYEEIVGITDPPVAGGYARTNQEVIDSISEGTANTAIINAVNTHLADSSDAGGKSLILNTVSDYITTDDGKNEIETVASNYITTGNGKNEIETIAEEKADSIATDKIDEYILSSEFKSSFLEKASDYIEEDENIDDIIRNTSQSYTQAYITTGNGKSEIETVASDYLNSTTVKGRISQVASDYITIGGGKTQISSEVASYISGIGGKNIISKTIADDTDSIKTSIENKTTSFLQTAGVFDDIIGNYIYPGALSTNIGPANSRVLTFDGTRESLNAGIYNKTTNPNNHCLSWLKSSLGANGASPYYGFVYPAMRSTSNNVEFAIQKYTVTNASKSYFNDSEKNALINIGLQEKDLISVQNNALMFETDDDNKNKTDYVLKVKYLISSPEKYGISFSWKLSNSSVVNDRVTIDKVEIIVSQHVSLKENKILCITDKFKLAYNNDISGESFTISGSGDVNNPKEIDLSAFYIKDELGNDIYTNFRVLTKTNNHVCDIEYHNGTVQDYTTDIDGIYTKHYFTCQYRYFNGNTISGKTVTANMSDYIGADGKKWPGYFDNASEAKLSNSKKLAYLISDGRWHTVYFHFIPKDFVFKSEKEKYLYFVRFICQPGTYGGIPGYTVYFKEISVYPDMNSAIANTGESAKFITNSYLETNITALNDRIEQLTSRLNALEARFL